MKADLKLCACGSLKGYADCCAPFIRGIRNPVTPEQLMRSRYSAYVMGDLGYLQQTHHPRYRTAEEDLKPSPGLPKWCRLDIIAASRSQVETNATVEFIALYLGENGLDAIHEKSNFIQIEGRWLYTDGQFLPLPKLGRNLSCPCGSQKKYKNCCYPKPN